MLTNDYAHPGVMPTIRFDGQVGPSSPVRRSDEGRFTDPVATLAAASLLTVALVIGAFATAQAPAPAPAAKVPGAVAVPGEFRLAPGNNQPPGMVVPLGPTRVTGEFRLAPGNNQPPGLDHGR